MKLLAYPRDDSNPYQRLLYDHMRLAGAQVGYAGCLTASHSLNLLLLPLELAIRRVAGYRVLHLHWVHGFSITGADRVPALRAVAQAWFAVCLTTMRILGLRLVWTAHNALPHEPVFADDMRARRWLVRACDLVLVHSQSALDELAGLGLVPRRSAVVAHGPLAPALPACPQRPGCRAAPRRLVFFGRVRDYKGVEDLLAAFARLPAAVPAELLVVGECTDARVRHNLQRLAARSGSKVTLRLERINDDELSQLLAGADAVVLPYRRVTTSGSAVLALGHGRPIVAPNLAGLDDLPGEAVMRYDGSLDGLADAIAAIAVADAAALARMSDAALRYCATLGWPQIAAVTISEIESALNPTPDNLVSEDGELDAAH